MHAGLELSPSTSMVVRGAVLAVVAPLLVARRPIGPAKDASFVATVEVIGGIMVERAKAGHRFGQEDLAVLESLAADAAVAVDSARLYRETREKAKIDHEMALARTIQAALLRPPPQVPFADVFAFSQSARFVGGDLYHAAVREDGALAVALGDVSGKGVPAALHHGDGAGPPRPPARARPADRLGAPGAQPQPDRAQPGQPFPDAGRGRARGRRHARTRQRRALPPRGAARRWHRRS